MGGFYFQRQKPTAQSTTILTYIELLPPIHPYNQTYCRLQYFSDDPQDISVF
ncbi:hypothetical protein NEISICOT_01233 [Neisseria sicca ATCC 29256]|uniref:Uncharacterized protein n=1 Tax=Neisseria sicca ATCC 29256 TaxID=547045 RepID=C6M3Z0_NEISI|nr:hypothetical protein NEISICOT_01233 [Neisseria sicca ATCC 29256]